MGMVFFGGSGRNIGLPATVGQGFQLNSISLQRVARRGQASIITALIGLSLLLSACVNVGPDLLRTGRNDYNVALQRTSDEQVLLNLVRLKYRDNPVFLEVSSVATQFDVAAGASASATLPKNAPDVFGLSGSVDYSEKPTVTYNLLQGQDFVQRFLAPVDLDTLLLLSRSGWGIDRLLRVVVEQMNGVPNAPRASGPQPGESPEFEAFNRVATLMRSVQLKGIIEQGFKELDGKRVPVIQFQEEANKQPEVQELFGILGLDLNLREFSLEAKAGRARGRSLALSTRSMMGVLFFLSQGVEVPDEDLSKGRVTITRDATGKPFDWLLVVGDLLHVRSQSLQPNNAFVAIRYRGSWFYIDDADLSSKSTFLMLSQLISLQAGKLEAAGPVLTLPLGP